MSAAWDEPAWRRLADELAAWSDAGWPATFWWRDDDAGPHTPALGRLLDLVRRVDLPLGLAVVPAWLTEPVVAEILEARASVAVLQHGTSHVNHETRPQPGESRVRPAELGAARALDVVLDELRAGWRRLDTALSDRLVRVLVPPWNRIAPSVVEALPRLGYQVLSTFGPRPRVESAPGLVTLNCHADPIAWREGGRFVGAAATLERLRAHLRARRVGQADVDEPTGLLSHHRVMDAPFWQFLETFLERLRRERGAVFPDVRRLATPPGDAGRP